MESTYLILIITTLIVLLNYIRVLRNRIKYLQERLASADRYIVGQTFHIIVLEGTLKTMMEVQEEVNHESNS